MNSALAVIFAAYAATMLDLAHERKIQGHNDLESVAALVGTPPYEYTRVVARVERPFDGFAFCTASRVGTNLFLTNYHCDQPCASTQFRMGFVDGATPAQQRLWKCGRLIHKEVEFDYALYEATPISGTAPFPVLTLWVGPLRDGQSVYLASHPLGKAMEVDASEDCKILDATAFLSAMGRMSIKHGCDTESSSSGSPVLDRATGFGVALHWGGLDAYNEAIPMRLVVDSLRANAPEAVLQLTLAGE